MFLLSDEEMEALYELHHVDYVIYLWLRRYMDFSSGVVGLSRGISRQMLLERCAVPVGPGRAAQALSTKALRVALDRLESRGLLRRFGGDQKLVFRMPLARSGKVRPQEEGPIWGRFGAEQVGPEGGPGSDCGESKYWRGSCDITPAEAGPDGGPIWGRPVPHEVGPSSDIRDQIDKRQSSRTGEVIARELMGDDDASDGWDRGMADPPTQAGDWLRVFNHEFGMDFNPCSVHDRRSNWPIWTRWVKAGVTRQQARDAVAEAWDKAKGPIVNLTAYVDRVMASKAEKTFSKGRHAERAAQLQALTGNPTDSEGEDYGRVVDATAYRVD